MNENLEKENREAEKQKHENLPGRSGAADFGAAIVLILFSIWAMINSLNYHSYSGDEFYIQPGFPPIVVCGFILVLALFLLKDSLKGSSVKERSMQLKNGIVSGLKSKAFWNVVAGLVILGIYVFILLKYLPFWIATFIVLFVVFSYIKVGTLVKRTIVAAAGTGLIILIFQVIFNVPLP